MKLESEIKYLKISQGEKRILDFLRRKRNQKVSIIFREGNPIRLEAEDEITFETNNSIEEVLSILKEKKFQNINIIQRNGKPVLLRRTETVLLNNAVDK